MDPMVQSGIERLTAEHELDVSAATDVRLERVLVESSV